MENLVKCLAYTRLGTGVVIGLAGTALALTGCSGSPVAAPAAATSAATTTQAVSSAAPTTTVTAVVTASVPVAATSGPAAVDYAEQYLADVKPWNVATGQIPPGATLTSPTVIAAAQQAVAVSQRLLQQSWSTIDLGDVHALAVEFDTIDEDVRANNYAKYQSDITTLNADANVVRAEFGAPAIK